MNILEIVFGHSCYCTMKNSKLNNNNILMINALLNIGDLSNIKNFEIFIPKELCLEDKNTNFINEINIIKENIKHKNKIRIWTSKHDIYSYLIMLYICSIIKEHKYKLFVLYSNELNEEFITPSVMKEKELEQLSNLEHELTQDEINNNANIWEKLVNENSELRVIKEGVVESVSIDYYDSYILETLKTMGKVKMSQLVAKIMSKNYLLDIMYVYLIERLIKRKKIKIILDNNTRYFENFIEITKGWYNEFKMGFKRII